MPKFKVSDTITLERTWIVEAKSEHGAIDQIDGLSAPAPAPDEEEQIDNTPYEAERIEDARVPHCDMVSDCREPVTHIDTRGFAYCTAHGLERRDSQPCRKLRAHEIRRLERGEQVTKY